MVMDDVIGVAMVMDDVRGSSFAPEEPMVRSLAQKCYFYTIFRDKMCQKEYYPKWDPSCHPILFPIHCLFYTSEKGCLTKLF